MLQNPTSRVLPFAAVGMLFGLSTVWAGSPSPQLPPPCQGVANSVEIEGKTSLDTKAWITCKYEVPDVCHASTECASVDTKENNTDTYTCYTMNPQMIEAAVDAVVGDNCIRLDGKWTLLGEKCTSLKVKKGENLPCGGNEPPP